MATVKIDFSPEFECPLCGSDSYDVAPHVLKVRDEVPIYKCAGCHFHFSHPHAFAPEPNERSPKRK